ncbi:MAG: cell wall-binding repeat-containing protein [Erysipelotrichaceae bacterium]|nr:cell wall-binding repeat-containing protein [Erysipelotrichaceae bacterium]
MNKYIYSKPKAKKIITTIIVCVMLLLGTLSSGNIVSAADTEATWTVGSNTYTSLSAAISAAGSSGTIKLASDGVLSAGTYTIPSGVKVIIPYNASSNTTPGNKPSYVGNSYTTPSPFRTLTMASGANIIVSNNAKLLVDGRYSAMGQANGYNGTPTGPYGKIIMARDSSITIQSGGELDAYGYITGSNNTSGTESGTVTALSGATVREYMQIKDFRGGSATLNIVNNHSNKVFPFSQYYIQNVEVPLNLYAGSHDYVYSGIYVSLLGTQETGAVELFGSSGSKGMFIIKSGFIRKTYISSEDRLCIDVNGDVELNSFSFKVYYTINTSEYVMPLTNNMTLNLKSGTTTVNQDSSLLPGVRLNIDEGATLKVSSAKNVYVYDVNTWNAGQYVIPVDANSHFYQLNYVAAINGAPVRRTLDNVIIDNNGLIDIQGSMYSTSERTVVSSSEGTGVVKFSTAAPADGTTYQITQEGTNVSYVSIGVTSLVLTNGDNTTTLTKGSAAGTEYFYCQTHNKWEKAPYHTITFDPNGGSGDPYTQLICQSQCQLIPNQFTREGYTFDGWNTKADGSGTAYADQGNITSSTDLTLYAQWKIHNHTYEVVQWRWNGFTSAEVDVRCTEDNTHTAVLPATITSEIISEPTCTEAGSKVYTATATYQSQTFTDPKIEVLNALGHDLVYSEEISTSCEEDGVAAHYQCSRCLKLFRDAEGNQEVTESELVITRTGHNWEFVDFSWDGYESAIANYKCLNDSSHTTTEAATVEIGESQAATCETDGYNVYTAVISATSSPDGKEHTETKQEPIPRSGHSWGEWTVTKEATCEETGIRSRTCLNCGNTVTEEIPAVGHKSGEPVQENIVSATCTSRGSYDEAVYCTVCGKELSRQTVYTEPTGHKWLEPEYIWSSDNSKVTATRVCEHDNTHIETDTAEVKTEVTEPTCEEAGWIRYSAEFKNDAFRKQTKEESYGSPKGHTPSQSVKENETHPDCENAGGYDEVVYCTVCKKEISRNHITIEALGHIWQFDGFIWSSGYSSVEGRFVCERDRSHVTVVSGEVDRQEAGNKITFTGTVKGPDGITYSETREVSVNNEIIRVYGSNRYYTGLKTSEYLKETRHTEKYDRIVITTGSNFADALAGSYLANKYNAPVILMSDTSAGAFNDIISQINDSISDNGKVYILGGTGAIPDERLNGIKRTKERIRGANRYLTNINILKKVGYNGGEILVCTGTGFADSLSASAVDLPILLVKDKLTDDQKVYLKQFDDIRFIIIGGTSAVSSAMEKELAQYGTVQERIAGSNRFATSAAIAARFFPDANNAVLAYGRNYPDGLSGGPLAYTLKAPLLLVESVDNNIAEAAQYCTDRNIKSGTVLGGSSLISDEYVRKIFHLKSDAIIKVFD